MKYLHVTRLPLRLVYFACALILILGLSPAYLAQAATSPVGAWLPAPNPMGTARIYHAATLLKDGRVLVTGGSSDGIAGALASAEIYDPSTGAWSLATPMNHARFDHTATLLNDGRVLIAGGTVDLSGSSAVNIAEIYDPTADTFTDVPDVMTTGVYGHTASLLGNGKVLIAGGINGSTVQTKAVIFDPTPGVVHPWSTTTNPMNHARMNFTATVYNTDNSDSELLVVGGDNGSDVLISSEIYDLDTNIWSTSANMDLKTEGRQLHTATLLNNHLVLVAGGTDHNSVSGLTTAEVFDPDSRTWTQVGSMAYGRYYHSANLLLDGSVLVAGGSDNPGTAELYDSTTQTWSTTWVGLDQIQSNQTGTSIISSQLNPTGLHGAVLLAGGTIPDTSPTAYAQIYYNDIGSIDPGAIYTWSNLDQITTDTLPVSVAVATTPDHNPFNAFYTFTSQGDNGTAYPTSTIQPTDSGYYDVVAQVYNPKFFGMANATLMIRSSSAISQSINFAPITSTTYNSSTPVSIVSPVSTSGLPVDLSIESGPCTLQSTVVGSDTQYSILTTGVGDCKLIATQIGNLDTLAAPAVHATITIGKATATILIIPNSLLQTYTGSPLHVTYTTTPQDLTAVITYTGISGTTYQASTNPPSNVGTFGLSAVIDNPNYFGTIQPLSDQLVITKAAQTLTFGPLANKTFGDANFTVSASTTSVLSITFIATDTCTVIGNNVHLTGAGSCTITATQSGDANHLAATPVIRTFTIAQGTATVSLSNTMQMFTGSPLHVGVTTVPANLVVEVTYVGSNGTVYPASLTPPTKIGTYTVTVVIKDTNYHGTGTGTFTITTNIVNFIYLPAVVKK